MCGEGWRGLQRKLCCEFWTREEMKICFAWIIYDCYIITRFLLLFCSYTSSSTYWRWLIECIHIFSLSLSFLRTSVLSLKFSSFLDEHPKIQQSCLAQVFRSLTRAQYETGKSFVCNCCCCCVLSLSYYYFWIYSCRKYLFEGCCVMNLLLEKYLQTKIEIFLSMQLNSTILLSYLTWPNIKWQLPKSFPLPFKIWAAQCESETDMEIELSSITPLNRLPSNANYFETFPLSSLILSFSLVICDIYIR